MELALGVTFRGLADDGRFVLRYHFATFLDGRLGGEGSHRAVNALRAAAEVGQGAFLGYLAVLYARQPDEAVDGFADPAFLLDAATEVRGLRGAEFDRAVREFTHRDWVARAQADFTHSGVTGTPTVLRDGTPLTVLDAAGEAVPPATFLAQLR
ncbi:protein-disulfide isomerase [Embleya sp. AB8]